MVWPITALPSWFSGLNNTAAQAYIAVIQAQPLSRSDRALRFYKRDSILLTLAHYLASLIWLAIAGFSAQGSRQLWPNTVDPGDFVAVQGLGKEGRMLITLGNCQGVGRHIFAYHVPGFLGQVFDATNA
jgi:hypothetical protein